MQRINKKGQALVEFVLIIPILIMVLFAIVDFSFIFYNKNHLEGVLNDSVTYVLNGKTDAEIKELIDDTSIKLTLNTNDNLVSIKLTKDIKLITPFIGSILDNPYTIETERVVLYE